MPKWKPVVLSKGLVEGAGELLGIEELECPDSNIIYQNPNRKRKCRATVKTKYSKKRKTSKTRRGAVKTSFTFTNFTHHDKMVAWNGFGLQDEILAALYDKKFFEPTEIQLKSLGPALCGFRDILGAAETGSGKTLAFGIPIVNGILKLKLKDNIAHNKDSEKSDLDEEEWTSNHSNIGCTLIKNVKSNKEENKLYALVLTPTRELAVQVKNHLTDICKYTNIRIVLLLGGLAHEKQERLLKKRPEIIVATPGRLWDLIQMRNIHLQCINKIRYLAIDETDRMLEKGHFDELNKVLECINFNEKDKKTRQNFVFSATLTLVHDPPLYLKGNARTRITPGQKLQELIKRIGITHPKIIDITNSQVTPENLREYKVICKFEEKDYYLHYFLKTNCGKTIIFCNSIGCVKRLSNLLSILNHSPLPLHANMMQKQRLKNLEKFRDKDNSVLIATDVAARGLDIPDVDHVLHYQVPKTAETYVHRSGRTARRKNPGNVLLLIEPDEYKSYSKLLHTLGRNNEIQDLQIDLTRLNRIKKVIHLTRDIDQLMLAVKKQSSRYNWYSKALEEMDMIIDEDELPKKVSNEASKKIKNDLKIKRKKLKAMLEEPEIARYSTGKFLTDEVKNSLLFNNKLNIHGPPV